MKRIAQERSVLGAFGATAVSLLLLVTWARELRTGWLIAALAVFLAGAFELVLAQRRGQRVSKALSVAAGVLLVGLGAATAFTWEFRRVERHWPDIVSQREAEQGRRLRDEMTRLVANGEEAATRASALAVSQEGARLFRSLELLRQQTQVDAVAVYTHAGDLVAWSGQHRGVVPDSIWEHAGAAYFEERPLFSYLYFSVDVPARQQRAIAAVLVETSVLGEAEDGFTAVASPHTRANASFRRGGGSAAVWSLVEGADTIVHARLGARTQAEWRGRLNVVTRALVLLLVLVAYVPLSLAWLRWTGPARSPLSILPLAVLVPIMALAPLRDALGAERLFSPLLFTLPTPGDISIGRLLALLLPIAALVAGARRIPWRAPHFALRLAAGAVVVAISYPLVLRLLLDGTTPELVESPAAYWLGFHVAAVLLLATITALALPRALPTDAAVRAALTPTRRRWLVLFASALCVCFGLFAAGRAGPGVAVRLATAALWSLPAVLAALAFAPVIGRAGSLGRWVMAGVIAATAVLPHLWVADVGARLDIAERELDTLGAREDPFLDYLLVNFSTEATARFAAGEGGVQLLYRTWVASGLARHPYPARIVLWSPSPLPPLPDVQLGATPPPTANDSARLVEIVQAARLRATPTVQSFADMPSMSKLLTVPLADGAIITVMIPPRRTLDRTSAIGQFLGAITASNTRLNLVETLETEPQHESVQWQPSRDGWRSEALVKYPDGWYHAHLSVSLPKSGVRFARAMLLLTMDMALLTLLWILGVIARGAAAAPRGAWSGWIGSFRARVTVSLFAFFLIPTAVFGWTAYRALSEEVARAAQTVAQHSVAQAAVEFEESVRTEAGTRHLLRDLAAHAGSDVLRYHRGELIEASAREAFEMGIYSAWMPPDIFQQLESREEVEALETQRLGAHAFVTAYRSLKPSGALGVPMSLSAGDVPLRQRERAHLVLFAAVIGALLSLVLSLPVGSALAGPIGLLRRAAAAVGAGSLRIHLPERPGDEFGQLFAAFNRMTRRLRRARARELRTARVLAWGEMARQVAHEIKNPLTPIKLSVQHLRRAYDDRHPQFGDILENNVSQILIEIDRLSDIARAFSRYGAPGLESEPLVAVDVGAVLRETLTLYRSGDQEVRYSEAIEPGLPRVSARSNELKEVLINLLENSRAALDGGGDIAVRAFMREERVELEVADNGRGIAPELVPRIFEPHFSTSSSGTGLGLAIVRRLVESWGGSVTAESDVDVGTIVRMRLQPADQPPAAAGA
ncbi:MAG TPA: ATP-binding protein [Longimicrobiales bacterium]|nr:ATP-binding protein [Longimicrobiales bacterium]